MAKGLKMTVSTESILECLELEVVGPDHYRGKNHAGARQFVSGGQLIGQMIVAAKLTDPSKNVKSIHANFARAGSPTAFVELELEIVHLGRTLGTLAATATQGDRTLGHAVILLDSGDEDVIRHQLPLPDNQGPDAAELLPSRAGGPERRIVGGIDLDKEQSNGPPEVLVWAKYPDAPDEPTTNQAILSFYIHNNLIPAAMRPHDGIGLSMAHETLSTGVITHAMTFHEPFLVSEWHLLVNTSTHASRGRTFGIGDVFAENGKHVASFTQESMIRRPLPGTSALRL